MHPPEPRTTGKDPMDERSIARLAPERAPKQGQASPQDELLEAAEEVLEWMRGFDRDAPAGMPPFEREAEVRVRLRTAIRKARRERAVPCASCGERFPWRDLVEVTEDDASLSWFPGDVLCEACVAAHGGIA